MSKYAYVRVSTPKQKVDRQIYNIKKFAPDAIICTEVYTGTSMDRPVWKRLLNKVKEGDTIIFDEVSRMARNSEEGFQIYQKLFQENKSLVFLKQPHINTDVYRQSLDRQIKVIINTGNTATDKLINSIIASLNTFLMDLVKQQIEIAFQEAETEVTYLRKRTSEGVRRAQMEGKQVGRAAGTKVETKKAKAAKTDIMKYSKDFSGSLKDKECMKLIGISPNTYYKYKKELREVHSPSESPLSSDSKDNIIYVYRIVKEDFYTGERSKRTKIIERTNPLKVGALYFQLGSHFPGSYRILELIEEKIDEYS